MSPTAKSSRSYTRLSTRLTGSLGQISKSIEDNAKLMDLVQEVAIELTHSIGTMHALTVKYAGTANSILDVLSPILRRVPLVPRGVTGALTKLEGVTRRIVSGQASREKTIADVHLGLMTGDVTKLRGHATELKSLTRSLLAILPK